MSKDKSTFAEVRFLKDGEWVDGYYLTKTNDGDMTTYAIISSEDGSVYECIHKEIKFYSSNLIQIKELKRIENKIEAKIIQLSELWSKNKDDSNEKLDEIINFFKKFRCGAFVDDCIEVAASLILSHTGGLI